MIVQGEIEKAYAMWCNIFSSDIFDVNDRDFKRLMSMDIITKDIFRCVRKLINKITKALIHKK